MATSRQLNFYFSNVDQEALTESYDKLGSVHSAMPPFSHPIVIGVPVATFSRWHSGEHYVILFRPSDVGQIVLKHISHDRGYSVDVTRSPVIEFSRCIQTNNEILRGRIYCVTRFVEDTGAEIVKSDSFIEWTKEIFRITQERCKIKRSGICIGNDAASLELLGYRLAPPG